MLLKSLLICIVLAFATANSSGDVTFKNVFIRGYSMYTSKFNVTAKSSKTLKENLPKKVFDKIEITDSEIPVLYKNSISDIEDLDELILQNDGITEIQPGSFKNVPQLRKLVIQDNKGLEEIKSGVFKGLKIATLDLSKNSINTISSDAFDNMLELLNVNLADNQLKIWDKNWFHNTPLLTRVSFQGNQIEEIPSGAFRNFAGEKRFGSLPLTINIILSNNKIKNIHDDAFEGLDKINNLWLDGNQIDTFSENLLSNVELKDLRLDNNKLECLTGGLENIFVATTTHIDGNPWDCGCLEPIDSWASRHGKDVVMYNSKMTCDVERIDRKLKDLNQRLKGLKDKESPKEQ